MEQNRKKRLEAAGMDVDGVLERLMGNEKLLERFLEKFLENPYYRNLTTAIEANNIQAALDASHALKGICGNLSMRALFDLLTMQVAAFRAENNQKAIDMMPEITEIYEKMIQAIRGE